MLIITLLFILGFVFLIKGADILVDGSSSIAKKFGISSLVIGLTIVAFGTSAPELVVSLMAAIRNSTGIALGNIIGSNISNSLLILGVVAIIAPVLVKKSTVSKEIPLSFLAILALGFLVNDKLIDGDLENVLSRIDGLILILFFIIFIYYTFGINKIEATEIEKEVGGEVQKKEEKIYKAVFMVLSGLILLYFGGRWIVEGAIYYATFFGLSEELIGLTIVALGTSLPELAASAVAALKKQTDMAIGNIVGSNIFNIFWVLGLSSIFAPISYNQDLNFDLITLACATLLILNMVFINRKNQIGKSGGILLLVIYFSYLGFLIFRG